MTIQQIVETAVWVLIGVGLILPLFVSICVATWVTAVKELRKLNEDKEMP